MLSRAPLRHLTRSSSTSLRLFPKTPLRSVSQDHKVSDGNIPVNDSKEPKSPANISATNAVPTSTTGGRDEALVEAPEDGERQRQMQAPNRKGTWARSQQERSKAMVGPRFEQTVMEFQVSSTVSICMNTGCGLDWIGEEFSNPHWARLCSARCRRAVIRCWVFWNPSRTWTV